MNLFWLTKSLWRAQTNPFGMRKWQNSRFRACMLCKTGDMSKLLVSISQLYQLMLSSKFIVNVWIYTFLYTRSLFGSFAFCSLLSYVKRKSCISRYSLDCFADKFEQAAQPSKEKAQIFFSWIQVLWCSYTSQKKLYLHYFLYCMHILHRVHCSWAECKICTGPQSYAPWPRQIVRKVRF